MNYISRIFQYVSPVFKNLAKIHLFRGLAGSPTAHVDSVLDEQNKQRAVRMALALEAASKSIRADADRFLRDLAAKVSVARPDWKCWHGVGAPGNPEAYQEYCEVCSWKRVDPDYNPATYKKEIDRALRNAKRILCRYEGSSERRDKAPLGEGNKNFAEIKMLVDLEIWKAVKKYGDKMNGALAYTVARNVAQKYLAGLIEEQTVLVGIALEFATPAEQEDAKRLMQGSDDVRVLERIAKDTRANADDRKKAQHLINAYGERIPRFESFDIPAKDENGKPLEYSVIEAEIACKRAKGPGPSQDELNVSVFETYRPGIEALVSHWFGQKKLVGLAMLRPGFAVCNVAGVSKSQTSRLYPIIAAEFKAEVQRLQSLDSAGDT